jgi:PQQ-dependent dehydrogenase (methanol/ethanol family)
MVNTENLSQLCRAALVILAALIATACDRGEPPAVQTTARAAPTSSPQQPAPPRVKPAAQVDAARIAAADSEPQNWLTHGRTYDEQRFSPLNQINDKNVAGLGLAWSFDLGTGRGSEATPLVVDGVMYLPGHWNVIFALDAKTGAELWHYDPHTRRDWTRFSCCDAINRGVAAWRGRIYEATLDGRLLALNAADGSLAWEVQTTDVNQPYSITGAPRVVNGKVIIGNSGAEFGVRGYVTAYDAESGKQVWRFFTVPGDPAKGFESKTMEMAAKTWSGAWWKYGAGGTAWDSFAFDPELNLLYIGTGNGGPWPRETRSPGGGDNLFLASIVAVDADTGEYRWHYQTVPGENWDFTAAQHMILAQLEIDGKPRKVLMQAPKNGFFYVIDRADGKLLSAGKIVPTNWADHVDLKTGRPVEIKENLYTDKAKLITPGPNGAHDWQPMSFSPLTGLVYIPTHEMSWAYSRDPHFKPQPWSWNIGHNPAAEPPPGADTAPIKGYLQAWDPVRQKQVWKVEQKGPWNGGVLTTAGDLLVQGDADGRFVIYTADTGAKLWEMPIHTGAVAGPVTYAVDGEQYIAVAAGWGGALTLMGGGFASVHHAETRVLAFKLGGKARLPASAPEPVMPRPPELKALPIVLEQGAAVYGARCGNCHGFNAISGGTIPDLRYLSEDTHSAFLDIVMGGIRAGNGMPSFTNVISESDANAVHAYIISRARETYPVE